MDTALTRADADVHHLNMPNSANGCFFLTLWASQISTGSFALEPRKCCRALCHWPIVDCFIRLTSFTRSRVTHSGSMKLPFGVGPAASRAAGTVFQCPSSMAAVPSLVAISQIPTGGALLFRFSFYLQFFHLMIRQLEWKCAYLNWLHLALCCTDIFAVCPLNCSASGNDKQLWIIHFWMRLLIWLIWFEAKLN